MNKTPDPQETEKQIKTALKPIIAFWEDQALPVFTEFKRLIEEYLIPIFDQMTGFIQVKQVNEICPRCQYKEARRIEALEMLIGILCPFCGFIDQREPHEEDKTK